MPDYIPGQDTLALAWMRAFSDGINASPSTYMMTAGEAAAIAAEVDAFDTALGVVLHPGTKTKVTVQEKNNARVAAEQICRQYARLIKYNAGISDDAKVNIGVRPVNTDREPIEAPGTSPILSIIAATQGAMTLRYSDTLTPDSPKRPFGAANIQVFVAIGDVPIFDPGLAQFYGAFTRNPIGVAFDPADNNKQATFFSRWASPRGDVGPWSVPVSMSIAA